MSIASFHVARSKIHPPYSNRETFRVSTPVRRSKRCTGRASFLSPKIKMVQRVSTQTRQRFKTTSGKLSVSSKNKKNKATTQLRRVARRRTTLRVDESETPSSNDFWMNFRRQ
ncbi:hypothetical protein BIW11_04727 [Tropilaelaps mercedesae]|uniref:Uncharacterized protein n=1 Tax=Tropilaelaps mercedesae TaxID=418985 RepID=A0A1V9X2C9_9ACAR|nr:hypothetical protein BIW11_04727 [Tropilaelaps mercedesae]